MHLRAMMTARAEGDDDVLKLIGTMDVLRQKLMNVCPDGTVSVDDLFVSSLISALPESWTSVTAPLELQPSVTPTELKKVLRGHSVKLKNRETSAPSTVSTAMAAASQPKRTKSNSQPKADCDYCKRRGHMSDVCHQKQMDDQRREIEALKNQMKRSGLTKLAKSAHVSDSDSDESLQDITAAKAKSSSSNRVKFSRMAATTHKTTVSDALVYNADTGCTDTLVKDASSLNSCKSIPSTPIYLADDTSIKAKAIGPVKLPINLPSVPGLLVPGLAENLLSIGQLADSGVTSICSKEKVEFYQSDLEVIGKKLGEGQRINRKYLVRPLTSLTTSTSPASLLTWHHRLSHLGEASVRRLDKQGVIEVTDWDRAGLENCKACRKGRMTRRRFGSRMKYRATRPLEIIHSDVCQLSQPSREGFKYFVSFIDDYSKFAVVYQMKSKSQVYDCFVHFTRRSERETGLKVVDLRSDNRGGIRLLSTTTMVSEGGYKTDYGPTSYTSTHRGGGAVQSDITGQIETQFKELYPSSTFLVRRFRICGMDHKSLTNQDECRLYDPI